MSDDIKNIEQCPNGCGEFECASQHIYTNRGETYFRAYIIYCPECIYIQEVDANL
jgi:hypothetical protein